MRQTLSSTFSRLLGSLLLFLFVPLASAAPPKHPLPAPHKHKHKATTPPKQSLAIKQVDIFGLLPKGSHIVVSLTDFPSLVKAFQRTALSALWKDPELKPLRKLLTRRLLEGRRRRRRYTHWRRRRYRHKRYSSRRRRRSAWRRRRPRKTPKTAWQRAQTLSKQLTGFSIDETVKIFEGPHAFALVGVPRGGQPIELAGVIGVRDAVKARLLLGAVLQRIPLKHASYRLMHSQVHVIRGLENAFHYTWHKRRFLFATTKDVMHTMLQNASTGHKGKSLLSDPHYRRFRAAVGLSRSVSVYVAASSLLRELAVNMGQKRTFFLRLLGLDTWDALGLAFGIQTGRFVSRFHISFRKGAKRHGLSRLLSLPPADTSLLNTTPAKASFVGLVRVPWTGLYDDAMRAFATMQPRSHKRFLRNIGRFERGILRAKIREVLKAFGESQAYFLYPYADGGLLPQSTFVFGLQDPALIQRTLKTLLNLAGARLEHKTYRDIKVQIVHSNIGRYGSLRIFPRGLRGLAGMLFGGRRRLCYAIVGKQLWFSLTPQTMRDFIDQQKQKQRPTPKQKRKQIIFHSGLQRGAKGAGAFVRFDGRHLWASFYNTFLAATPWIGPRMLRGFRLLRGVPLHQLPRSSTVTRRMKVRTFFSRHAKHQTLLSTRSGFGLEMLVLAGGLAASGGRLFFQHRTRRYLNEVVSFLRLEDRSKRYLKRRLFALAARQWKRLAKRARLEAVALAARKQATRFSSLAKARTAQIRKNLQRLYKKQQLQLQRWVFHGDWHLNDGELHALTHRRASAAAYFGASALSTYILQFQVRNPSRGFSLILHAPSSTMAHSRRKSSYSRGAKRLYFARHRFQKDRWVPIKVKVKGRRISYWFGLKHYTVYARRNNGHIGFTVPRRGTFAMRNLKVDVPAPLTPKPPAALAPSLSLSLRTIPTTVERGEMAEVRLSIHNRGQLPARKLNIKLQLSDHLKLLFSSTKPRIRFSSKQGGLVQLAPAVLNGGKTLQLRLRVRCIKAGSAAASAFISFASMKGEITISDRLHIIGPDATPATPKKKTESKPNKPRRSFGLGTGKPHRGFGFGTGKRVVRVAPPTRKGSLSRKAILRTVRRYIRAVRYCYTSQLSKNPKLKGRVVVSFTIGAKGRVKHARIRRSSLNNAQVESCMLIIVKNMLFPQPKGGGIVRVNYPFVFRAR